MIFSWVWAAKVGTKLQRGKQQTSLKCYLNYASKVSFLCQNLPWNRNTGRFNFVPITMFSCVLKRHWFRMEQETRLTYSIKACSTEAPGYAAENLRDLASTGWRSTDLCDFPQSIICKLECESTLRKIQLLGHNFLIPQRVVLYIGNFNNKYEKHIWKKIGFVTFSDNANTNFKQRELKTINLKARCLLYFSKLFDFIQWKLVIKL